MTYPGSSDPEAPEADAAEQATVAYAGDAAEDGMPSLDDEAPEWDAQEQSRSVPLEDDYR